MMIQEMAANAAGSGELTASVVAGYVIVVLIQWVKKQRWIPFIDHCNTANINRFVAAFMALATSIGIHFKYDGSDGSLLVTGLSLSSILPLAGEAIRQFVVQQLIYKGAGFEAKSEKKAEESGSVDVRKYRSGTGDGA